MPDNACNCLIITLFMIRISKDSDNLKKKNAIGCSAGTVKNCLLIAQARKRTKSGDRCPFFIRYIHFDI